MRGSQREEEEDKEKDKEIEKRAQMSTRRKHIANEIYTTEISYVTDLSVIIQV